MAEINLTEIGLYKNRVRQIAEEKIDWATLEGRTIMITGATGMIGKMLIDVLMCRNDERKKKIHVLAVGRNVEKARTRLNDCFERDDFEFLEMDMSDSITTAIDKNIDYMIHAASATHPLQYSNDPVGTIIPNVIGLNNLLKLAVEKKSKRLLFLSSVEIYGENRKDTEKFDEKYLGYIDCNTLRAGYTESKRVGEALCQAYREQHGVDFVTLRLARVFGPTMLMGDSKASSQFIKNALVREDIILKSNGAQEYSYLYVADAVRAILYGLVYGESGEAYNVADKKFDISLKGLAECCAGLVGKKVAFELPSEQEKKGFSKANKALLDGEKFQKIGFSIDGNLKDCLAETLDILSS